MENSPIIGREQFISDSKREGERDQCGKLYLFPLFFPLGQAASMLVLNIYSFRSHKTSLSMSDTAINDRENHVDTNNNMVITRGKGCRVR